MAIDLIALMDDAGKGKPGFYSVNGMEFSVFVKEISLTMSTTENKIEKVDLFVIPVNGFGGSWIPAKDFSLDETKKVVLSGVKRIGMGFWDREEKQDDERERPGYHGIH